jgi:hypothetical protein
MLAMADKHGRVFGSIPGLANRARISVEASEKAIEKFKSPDTYSRTKTHDGRRIEEIDGGWRLLNHAKYRAIRDVEARREGQRDWLRDKRAKSKALKMGVDGAAVDQVDDNVVDYRPNAEAESDAEAYPLKKKKKNTPMARFNPSIPKELAGDEKFVELWELHCGDIRGSKTHLEANKLEAKQLGFCRKMVQDSGFERAYGALDGAIAGGSLHLLDPEYAQYFK